MADPAAPPEDYRGFAMAAFVLALGGWAGLGYLVFGGFVPEAGPRWLFFVLLLAALTGTAAPFVHYLSRRFSRRPAPAGVLLRQSLWVGFFGTTCAWLQIPRSLNLSLALLLAAALAGIEWFLRMRERSRWSPELEDEPA